jgi:hypothetical protein
MNGNVSAQVSIELLLSTLLFSAGSAGILVVFGARFRKFLPSVTGVAALFMGAVAVRYALVLTESDLYEVPLLRGWLLPRSEAGALVVGFVVSRAGALMTFLAALFSLGFVVESFRKSRVTARDSSLRVEREFAALLLAAVGVSVAWLGGSLWVALGGTCLSLGAGAFSLGARWDEEVEADLSVRFGRERFAPLGLALLGAGSLASQGVRLAFDLSAIPSISGSGAFLLIVGLILLLPQFPVLGSAVAPANDSLFRRTLFLQVFPAASVAGVFFFLSRAFTSPLFPAAVLILLSLAALTAFVGIFQADWRRAFGPWVTTGVSLAMAALLVAGPLAGVSLLIPALTVPLVLSFAMDTQRAGVPRSLGIFVVALATGWPGSMALVGMARWLSASPDVATGSVVLALFVHLLYSLLSWRVAGAASRAGVQQSSMDLLPGELWASRAGLFFLALPAVGLFWTGSLSGGVWFEDQWFGSLMAGLFPPAEPLSAEARQATLFYQGTVLLVGAFLGYSLSGRKDLDRWESFRKAFPRLVAFVESGFHAQFALGRVERFLRVAAEASSRLFEAGLWLRTFPAVARALGTRAAPLVEGLDFRIRQILVRGLSRFIATPGRGLQAIQSGDLQWYLFFALTVGIGFILVF